MPPLEDEPAVEVSLGSYSLAMMNMLEDMSRERDLLQDGQRAMQNILEDTSEGAVRLTDVQPALLNIFEDLAGERDQLESGQRAMLNILEDTSDSAARLTQIQPALLNILEDLEAEKSAMVILNDELESRVLRRTDELHRSNRDLEAFTYSVAHDLRAPLRATSGFSEALLSEYGNLLDETGRGYAERVRDASRRMAVLIDELLALSQVSRSELNREWLDLTAMANAVVTDLQSQDSARAVQWHIEPGMSTWADRSLMRVVLENLLGNAWKFSSKTNDAQIAFGSLPAAATEDGWCVRDNGVGFDSAFQDQLFKPFHRLHKAIEFPGNGIGLASVARIAERHGGRVWAESTVGQGATFCFTVSRRR